MIAYVHMQSCTYVHMHMYIAVYYTYVDTATNTVLKENYIMGRDCGKN